MGDAVARGAETPDRLKVGPQIVHETHAASRCAHLGGPRRHVPFEAPATDRAGQHPSFGVHQQAGTRLTVRTAVDLYQRGQREGHLRAGRHGFRRRAGKLAEFGHTGRTEAQGVMSEHVITCRHRHKSQGTTGNEVPDDAEAQSAQSSLRITIKMTLCVLCALCSSA